MSVLEEVEKLKQEIKSEKTSEAKGKVTEANGEVSEAKGKEAETISIKGEANIETISMEEEVKEVTQGEIVEQVSVKKGLQGMIQKTIESGKEMKDLAKDLTYLAGASSLQENDEFKDVYQEVLGKQLVEDLKDEGKRQAVINAARKQEAKNIRATAFYDSCRPIFELLAIKQAFGLIPMAITVAMLLAPFLAVSFIRFIFNSVNSIAEAVAGFKKPAFWLCTMILCVTLTAAVVLLALWGVDTIFGTSILPQ